MKDTYRKGLSFLALFVCLVSQLALTSCKSDATVDQDVVREILEIFKVAVDGNQKKPTTLSYKDIKYFKDGKVFRQDFFHVDNSLKGVELLTREGNKGISNYYAPDSTLLAIYHLEYEGDNITKKSGYDGQSNALLRTEVYTYNLDNGKRNAKNLYDETGRLVKKYTMTHDAHGNETGVVVLASNGTELVNESFEVTKKDATNRWLEKWGSTSGMVTTFHRRTFK